MGIASLRRWAVAAVLLLVVVLGSPLGCSSGSTGFSSGGGEGGGGCGDTTSDTLNCGACGHACGSREVCTGGKCGLSCAGGSMQCGGACIDPSTDPFNCGGCGEKCGAGMVCTPSGCSSTCATGQTTCGGDGGAPYCANTASDGANCGKCGHRCASGEACSAGTCTSACPGKEVMCGGQCVDPMTSNVYCGASAGCGTDGGSAGTACGPGMACNAGACTVTCPGAEIVCGGECIDPTTSDSHCGATAGCGMSDAGTAGMACPSGERCTAGMCVISCPGTEIVCGGECIDPSNSNTNCGATAGCGVGGVGSPGIACPAGEACSGSVCSSGCSGGDVLCGGVCIDPSTSNTNCGATAGCGAGGIGSAGMMCTSPETCVGAVCTSSSSVLLDFPISTDTRVVVSPPNLWHMGDYVDGSRAAALASTTMATINISLTSNSLTCDTQDMEMLINGSVVGTFKVSSGESTVATSFSYAAIAGTTYDLRYETTRTVASGCGSAGISNTGSTVTLQ